MNVTAAASNAIKYLRLDRLSFLPSSIDLKYTLPVLLLLVVVNRVFVFFKKLRSVNYIKGPRIAFNPWTFPGIFFKTSRFTYSHNFQWDRRFHLYKDFDQDVVSIVPLISGPPVVWTNNLDLAKVVTAGGSQTTFTKPPWISTALALWGNNVASMEGGEPWRRHRRIMGPAYNNQLYELVWEESCRIYHDMIMTESWDSKTLIDINAVQDFSYKFALMVIAACGFGTPMPWSDYSKDKDGKMTVHEAMRILSDTVVIRVSVPAWIRKNLPFKYFSDMEESFSTLDRFLRSQIALRKKEIKEDLSLGRNFDGGRRDVFSFLVRANEDVEEKYPLDDNELIGNVYGLLLAGHETTGHTLAVALGFLALHQDEQKNVYEQIMDVVGNNRDPLYSDYQALYKVLAVFYESARLFPGGNSLVRQANEDTVIAITRSDGSIENQVIQKGTNFFIDVFGIQYNSRYFQDPLAFKPSRWYTQETADQPDAVTTFSLGPRACIGRRFAMTEAVAFLTLFIRNWHVDVVLNKGETREQWRERVMQGTMKITFSVKPIPIRMTRRK